MLIQHKLAIASALSALALAAGAQTAAPAAPAADAQGQATGSTQGAAAGQSDSAGVVKAAFKRADANNDGKLSREEAAALPAVAEKFTQLDKNSDGSIGAEEFEAGVTTGQPAATK